MIKVVKPRTQSTVVLDGLGRRVPYRKLGVPTYFDLTLRRRWCEGDLAIMNADGVFLLCNEAPPVTKTKPKKAKEEEAKE